MERMKGEGRLDPVLTSWLRERYFSPLQGAEWWPRPSPPNARPYPNPQNCECDLIRKKVFVDVIKLRISRWDHPGLPGWTLNPMISVVLKDAEGETETPRGESHTVSEAETGDAWGHQAGRGKEGSSPRDFRGNTALPMP